MDIRKLNILMILFIWTFATLSLSCDNPEEPFIIRNSLSERVSLEMYDGPYGIRLSGGAGQWWTYVIDIDSGQSMAVRY